MEAISLKEYLDNQINLLREENRTLLKSFEKLNETRHQEIEKAASIALSSARENLEARFQGLKNLEELQHSEQAKATELALDAVNARLQIMNEFRSSVSDITQMSATRAELEQLKERLTERIKRNEDEVSDLKTFRAIVDSKASQVSVIFSIVMSVASLTLGIISLLLKFIGG
jgi:DNA repair exonuclease SbcCD ATPase subunit